MSPFQFDSDMSDVSTTPVGLPDLGDLPLLPLVRQRAEPRDPLEIELSSDLMDVDLSDLRDLTLLPLVRQRAEPRDPPWSTHQPLVIPQPVT